MTKYIWAITLMLAGMSRLTIAGETIGEYASELGIINFTYSEYNQMGYVCKDTLYPGINLAVPEWLLMQLDQAMQDNPDYPKFTTFREVSDVYDMPLSYRKSIRPGREEECAERARLHIENIRKAVSDNIKNLNNPDYIPFRIASYAFYLRLHEQLPWWGGNKLARRSAVEFVRRVYYEVQSKFQNMNYVCRDVWYPNTHLTIPLWLEIQLLWAENNNPYYPESTLFRQVEEEYGASLAHADPIIPGEEDKCIERANRYASAIKNAVEDNIDFREVNASWYIPFDIKSYSTRVKSREQLNQITRIVEKHD